MKKFYQRWKGVLETETGAQAQNDGVRTRAPAGVEVGLLNDSECSELEASSIDIERKYDRLMMGRTNQRLETDPTGKRSRSNDYSYNNLNRMLDTKLKSYVPEQNHFFAKREVMKSTDTKNRVAGIFQDHAQWLKTLKLQVRATIFLIINISTSSIRIFTINPRR